MEVDIFRLRLIEKIAKEENRSAEEMLQIILDRGLDWWAKNIGGVAREERK